jgi:hypothetical protein
MVGADHDMNQSRARQTICAAFLAAIFGLFSTHTFADELADVATILGGRDSTIRKWNRSPKVAVISAGAFNEMALVETIGMINTNTNLGIDSSIEVLDLKTIGDGFVGASSFLLNVDRDQAISAGHLTLENSSVDADIFIFVVDRKTAAYLSVLTESAAGTPRLTREFSEGVSDCYFHMRSRKGEIIVSYIFINRHAPDKTIRNCLYEELTQSMGLVADADGTPFFTYDNLLESKLVNRDSTILAALYSPDIEPGDAVERVLDAYAKLISLP